ncbi:hypothetical protein HF289_03255 [Acidithiobacillus ferrooxidans]|uniref:hypothetical protein n=1 Tax=Acidithiobacillus ferrooxidans TaxID=920 RepID=UPI001C066461|nr:hypothetical protein [Acidithiobacillus ferrooxidans]MBU2855929.1 hypothetical protein [Acidithiobacillus ferrooxidans]
MNTSNSVPADSEIASPPALLWEWTAKVLLPLLWAYVLLATRGGLEEFGILKTNLCERYNAKIRANGKLLWGRTIATYRDMRSPRGVTRLVHRYLPRSSAVTMMPRAAGRQSGQRRTPRKGGQAKKASNDPDGGDGEPPRPPRSLPSSRHHAPHLYSSLTRSLIAEGASW